MKENYDAPTELDLRGGTQYGSNDTDQYCPILIIACHPDANRLGEYALLDRLWLQGEQELNRHWPEFIGERDSFGRGLAVPHVSRKSLRFERVGQEQIKLSKGDYSAPVKVHNQALDDAIIIDKQMLDNGLQINLSDTILLLLKYIRVPAYPVREYGLVGISENVDSVRQRINQIAGLSESALVRGATGTGKELVAQALYNTSERAKQTFVSVNLAALQESLAAAELFGAVKGAYTGATSERKGYFRAAHGGTLFLDEIGEASPEVQAMLLRVLETGEIMPVGATRAEQVDVRIIAATDANLEEMDNFKVPLLHRLSTYPIYLAPLRERCEDIPLILGHFLKQKWMQLNPTETLLPSDLETPLLSPELVSVLLEARWPGNIRQLRNVAFQLIIDGRQKRQLRLDAQTRQMLMGDPNQSEPSATASKTTPERRKPNQISRDELASALRANRFELQATANDLQVSRASVYLMIQRHPSLRQVADISESELKECFNRHGGDLENMMWELEVSQIGLRRRLRAMGFNA